MSSNYKKLETGQWTWEFKQNNEIWGQGTFNTKEDAILEALAEIRYTGEEEIIGGFYVGQVAPIPFPHIPVDNILENLNEQVYEQVGEVADDYLLDVKREEEKELEKRINSVFQKWAKEYGHEPTYFTVINIEFVSIDKARKIEKCEHPK